MTSFDFHEMGIAVIPVYFRTKIPMVAWRQYQDKLPSKTLLHTWFRPGRHVNAAAICGHRGLTIIDFDTQAAYQSWLDWANGQTGVARELARQTYRVHTSRGVHLYLFVTDRPRTAHFDGGDVKGVGGYVLIPPSVHPSGIAYVAEKDDAPIQTVSSLAEILPNLPTVIVSRPPHKKLYADPWASIYPKTTIERIKESISIL